MTIPEYLKGVERNSGPKDVVYYYNDPFHEFAANTLSDSTGIPVLPLWDTHDNLFVRAVCNRQDLSLRSFSDLVGPTTFGPPPDLDSYHRIVAACASHNIVAEVRQFEPAHIPAMLIEDNSWEDHNRVLDYLREGDPQLAAKLQRDLERGRAVNAGMAFYLNSANPLIRDLREAPLETQEAICQALYNISFMSAKPDLKKNEVQAVYDSISSVLVSLLNQAAPQSNTSAAGGRGCRSTRLLLITSDEPADRDILAGARDVFESAPCFFEVTATPGLCAGPDPFATLRTAIEAADAILLEITDPTIEVMFTLGATLVRIDASRPVWLLRRATAAQPMPSFLDRGRVITYADPSPQAVAKGLREALAQSDHPAYRDFAVLLQRRTCKALTRTLLVKTDCVFQGSEIDRLLASFPTVEHFLDATAADVSRMIDISEPKVVYIQSELQRQITPASIAEARGGRANP